MESNKKKIALALAIGIPSALLLYYSFSKKVKELKNVYYSFSSLKLTYSNPDYRFDSVSKIPNEVSELNKVSVEARALLCEHVFFSSVTKSTQIFLDHSFRYHPSGLIYIADIQTTGQGRTGNWESKNGCLMFSFKFSCPANKALPLQLAIPLSIISAVLRSSKAGNDLTGLLAKYPNDVYLNGKKLAGILVNSVNYGKQLIMTIGIGINVANQSEYASLEESFPGQFRKEEILRNFLEEFWNCVKDIENPSWSKEVISRYKGKWMHFQKKGMTRDQKEWIIDDINEEGVIGLKDSQGETKNIQNREDIVFL